MLVVDRTRMYVGFDVEFLLHLLLDIYSRRAGQPHGPPPGAATPSTAASAEQNSSNGNGASPPDEAVHSGELHERRLGRMMRLAMQSVDTEPAFQELGMSEEVWRAWTQNLALDVQLEALVHAATEPRVAAMGAQELVQGGRALGGNGSRADQLRSALALIKVLPRGSCRRAST